MDIQRKSAAAWFEIPCADLDRAQRFYETILGCRMTKDDFGDAGDVMCVFPAERGGVSGALVKRTFQQPSNNGTMVYLNCDGELDALRIQRAIMSASILRSDVVRSGN